MTVSVDFETRSTVDLRRTGVYKYAQDLNTDVWCMAYAFDDNEPQVWRPGDELDQKFVEYITQKGELRAWNANFERTIWNEILVPRYGWPKTTIEQWVCTASEARAMALPGSLEMSAKVLGVQEQKDKEGSNLMLRMARPRSIQTDGTIIWWDVPERVQRLVRYCLQDVRTEVAIAKAIRRLVDTETQVFNLDQTINDRGVRLDIKLAKAAKKLAEKATLEANRLLYDVTNGKVAKVSSVAQLTAWLKEQGLEVADGLGKDQIKDLLSKASGPALEALALRSEAGKSSVAKIESMLEAVCQDGRIRGLLLYHGATTGRWAGRLVQPQNFPRGDVSNAEEYIPLVYSKDYEALDATAPVLSVISSLLRSMLIAENGHRLIAADFAAIEARVLAWLAGEEELLENFRTGGDVYRVMASKIYSITPGAVNSVQRQVGKMSILGLGYGMGAKKFTDSCQKQAGVTLTEDQAKTVVQLYRNTNANIVGFWGHLNRAAINAVKNPGSVQAVGDIKYTSRGGYLWCVLPSKRPLAYAKPRIVERETPWGSTNEAVSFEGLDSFTKKWERHDLYGGLLAENVTQAVARDIMADAMIRLEKAGYPLILSVHDEIVAEVPDGFGSVAEFESLMCQVPQWAEGCPIDAEGWEGERYRK
jgi:DNA polymerase